MDRKSHVTIREVAALAGVSVGTASKALNGRGKLREATRQQVLDAARRLNFEPNHLARSLLSGRTYTVGVITSDSFGRFVIPVMQGIEDALGADRIGVYLCDARGDAIREQWYLSSLLTRRVDGIVISGRRVDPRHPIGGGSLPVPVVYAFSQSTDPADLSVIPDDLQAGQIAVRHLIEAGRRKIAHVTGPTHFEAVRLRYEGARLATEEAGLELEPGRVLAGTWSEEWGREAAELLMEGHPDVDAVFCGSDQIARGVADTLRERGVRVPDDVALVGYDNWEVFAASTRPSLTSVDPRLEEVGRTAARLLLSQIDGAKAFGVHRIPCQLVVRISSGMRGIREPGSIPRPRTA